MLYTAHGLQLQSTNVHVLDKKFFPMVCDLTVSNYDLLADLVVYLVKSVSTNSLISALYLDDLSSDGYLLFRVAQLLKPLGSTQEGPTLSVPHANQRSIAMTHNLVKSTAPEVSESESEAVLGVYGPACPTREPTERYIVWPCLQPKPAGYIECSGVCNMLKFRVPEFSSEYIVAMQASELNGPSPWSSIYQYPNILTVLYMVRNPGAEFVKILEHNSMYGEHTIVMDTGSTDGTVEVLDKLSSSELTVIHRKWQGFSKSRNELLQYARERNECSAYMIMLDDSYIFEGDVDIFRSFLTQSLASDYIESMSIFITDADTTYSSNRVFRRDVVLPYRYRVHEVPQTNLNVEIPANIISIRDITLEGHVERTRARKLEDIEALKMDQCDYPSDPRIMYYLAESWLSLQNYQRAYYYYEKRANSPVSVGFALEIQDSCYKLASIGHYNLGVEWSRVKKLYWRSFNVDITRTDSLIMLGILYIDSRKKLRKGFKILERAWDLSLQYPNPPTMNGRTKLISEHLPRALLSACVMLNRPDLGIAVARRIGDSRWELVFSARLEYDIARQRMLQTRSLPLQTEFGCEGQSILASKAGVIDRLILAFIAPGGWAPWDGETLEAHGLGGSETAIIRFAENIACIAPHLLPVVFCTTPGSVCREYHGVWYCPLWAFSDVASRHLIDVCIIHRCPSLLYACLSVDPPIRRVSCMLHDIITPGEPLPLIGNTSKLDKLICLSQWHHRQIEGIYNPQISAQYGAITSYGIDMALWPREQNSCEWARFIFPSFANRGLVPLLRMWPRIYKCFPGAILDVFCDLENTWLKNNYGTLLPEIELGLQQPGITNHGWVSESVLRSYWQRAHIWLYPCTFEETYCRVALEAAASGTLGVCSDLAALAETAGPYLIPASGSLVITPEWENAAFEQVFIILDGPQSPEVTKAREERYEWADTHDYKVIAKKFYEEFVV